MGCHSHSTPYKKSLCDVISSYIDTIFVTVNSLKLSPDQVVTLSDFLGGADATDDGDASAHGHW